MKRIISICLLMFMLISAYAPLFAFAIDNPIATASPKSPSSVTITVVMPEKEQVNEPIQQPAAPVFLNVYPIDVTENCDNGGRQIIKTYELNASERPSDIPRDSLSIAAGSTHLRTFSEKKLQMLKQKSIRR